MNKKPMAAGSADFPEFEPLPERIAEQVGSLLIQPTWMGLALHLPLRFEDLATLTALEALEVGEKVNLVATVTAQEVTFKPRKQLKVWVDQGDVNLQLRWMHFYPGLQTKLQEGTHVKVSGQIRQGYGCKEIIHPQITVLSPAQYEAAVNTLRSTNAQSGAHAETATQAPSAFPDKLTPVYPSTANLRQSQWSRWIAQLPKACFFDPLPLSLTQQYKLMPWETALKTLHGQETPERMRELNDRAHPAWVRIKFDELLAQQLMLRQMRDQRKKELAPAMPFSRSIISTRNTTKPSATSCYEALLNRLPFSLTQAQRRAVDEIRQDMANPYPMQRLLQGDVGSGKTVVSALVAAVAADHGKQSAILAPTEVLAEQHWYKLKPLFDQAGISSAKLNGSMKKSEKAKVLEALENGMIDVIIGTHAIVQDHVKFKSLGLVVVDEQHRFGVAQRLALISKAGTDGQPLLAHQLMMSATPIPRTLAQTWLSDLSLSVLDEKPPGRKPIITKLLSQAKREQLIQAIEVEAKQGKQVYWVCPLIEESEQLDLQAAIVTHQILTESLPNIQVGLLHGKQDAKTKQHVMGEFAAGRIQVLVSTTVIEVGVDVSNASLMVIDQAERFGLAQLHQLRGRVGRGENQSVCVLLYGSPLSATARMRLKAMHESDDGFYLAEKDLEIRGPGEILGKRQSGLPGLRYADPLVDIPLVETARQVAGILDIQSTEVKRLMQRWVEDTPWWLG